MAEKDPCSLPDILDLHKLQAAYAEKRLSPTQLIKQLYPRLQAEEATFITLAELDDLLDTCRQLEAQPQEERGSLWGVPFAVKDNVDVAGYPTTAACAAFKYHPKRSAPAIEALLHEGGIMLGKTNLDQFATGLVGTRSPYGTPRNAFDDRFVPGGSSSGSAAVVGSGLATFAVGTDTAGSGRVPAQFNGCVGIKPTKGMVTTQGVVPACRSLDCLSCFARSVEDGATIVHIMQKAGKPEDPLWRARPPHLPKPPPFSPRTSTTPAIQHAANAAANGHATNGHAKPHFRFGIPTPEYLDFSGPGGPAVAEAAQTLFKEAVQRMQALGGEMVQVDFSAADKIAGMLYGGAFLAERYSALRGFLEQSGKARPTPEQLAADPRIERVLGAILSGATKWTGADVYDAQAELVTATAHTRLELAKVDFFLVPTALNHFTVAEIEGQEKGGEGAQLTWAFNGRLGRFTNFVNLMDMCGISVPSGVLEHPLLPTDGSQAEADVAKRAEHLSATGDPTPSLPFGVTLLAPAWGDEMLWAHAAKFVRAAGLGCGPEGHGVLAYKSSGKP
ncbi:hypothetical protein WJX73_009893 [Symbiochloris irregularis]|uniref:Amidase domain-containing protein n=1 Tax=Symbiochloris irregularis TaxID=706552 RepID=A0AAW1P4U7_9CHLO